MTRTHEKVSYAPEGKPAELTPLSAAAQVEKILKMLEGRWKLSILFQLFGGKVLRFSELERAIPAVSQKMLIQQLRQMEADGMVRRVIYPEVPPKVEYALTQWGQALCPTLDSLLKWAAVREELTVPENSAADDAAWGVNEAEASPAGQGRLTDRLSRQPNKHGSK